jgi:hypothetical protein
VCLHCRRDARKATRLSRQRLAIKALAIVIGSSAALAAVGGLAIAVARAHPARMVGAVASGIDALRVRVHALVADDDTVATPASAETVALSETRIAHEDAGRVLLPAPPVAVPPAPALPPTPPLMPIVAQGATRLRDSVVAVRTGDSVTVHFDTPRSRTRRPEKFEQIVRSTLPAIYGPMVDSVLDRIPSGELARAGDLLTDLPTRGLRLSLGDGWAVALWPETRRGQDGPLVVMYRAMVTRLQ